LLVHRIKNYPDTPTTRELGIERKIVWAETPATLHYDESTKLLFAIEVEIVILLYEY
jgi:hypothetical protein